MRVSAALEVGSAYDRRRYARRPVRFGAGIAAPERPVSNAAIVDLSTHGCGIETELELEIGSRVLIKIAGLESWPATVRWASNGRAGLSFERPLHQAVVDRYR